MRILLLDHIIYIMPDIVEEQSQTKLQSKTQEAPTKLSKNQQKRQAKQKLKEEKDAQKKAKKQQDQALKIKDKDEFQIQTKQELDPNKYYQNRCKVIKKLIETKQPNPYPHKFNVTCSIPSFIQKYSHAKDQQVIPEIVSVAGRISNIRIQSKKLIFYDLRADGVKIQVLASLNNHKGKYEFSKIHRLLRRGDIIGILGKPGRAKTGQLSIYAQETQLLSPCLYMMPEFHVGIKHQQTRFRKRYLDLFFNCKARQTFIVRNKIIKYVRSFLENRNFLQVQTPMMNMIPGGATARPFKTFHNDLQMDLYMRIAPQLYLKQLVVGGFDRVFQIGKNFRNQSIDQTHNPQYTACQAYMAYADFQDWISMTQQLLAGMVMSIKGSYKIIIHPDPSKPQFTRQIDFTPPWRRISMMEELQACLKQELPKDLSTQQARQFFDKQCLKFQVACSAPRSVTRLIDKLVGHFLEVQCLNPTFIIEHPQLMSPLSKYHRNKPGLTQRFQLFINYHQFCNSYTQLNDPFKQKDLFQDQVKQKDAGGDKEAMFYDKVFVQSLQYGLPPTGGWGLGIDRTIMLLSDNFKIQEVILFPAMKPVQDVKQVEKLIQKKE